MWSVFREIDEFLRERADADLRLERVPLARLLVLVAGGTFLHGLVMGTRYASELQSLYSGIKVPFLLGVTTLLCLPSFWVLHQLLGLTRDFPDALRAVLSAQACLAIALVSMSPILALLYVSGIDYDFALLANGLLFLIATSAAQVRLARSYRDLLRRDARHRWTRRAWLVTYVFVAIQFAWVLRPFIGSPRLEPQFFRADAWSNAYTKMLEILMRAF
jgi:hypothetical protein